MSTIAISRVHFPVTTLGPGRRIGIWMQGCSIRCPGCISADTWATGRGIVSLASLIDHLAPWFADSDGVTVSGGEPFEQAAALRALLAAVRERTSADILVYSGHAFETIRPEIAGMSGLIDAIITDPYLIDAPQTLVLRGSDNQRLHILTALGEARFADFINLRQSERALDVMFDDDGSAWFAGIPRREEWEGMQRHLRTAGVRFATSADAAPADGGNRSA